MLRRPPRSTRTTTLPYTTRFRSAQGDALLLATRQRPRTALQQRLDAEQGDHPLEAARPLGRRRPAEAVEQVVAHRKAGKQTAFLAHVAEAPTLRLQVDRSEESRVGKESVRRCTSTSSPYHYKKKNQQHRQCNY